ncbi:MAG TPA: Gldg family protein [Burkholderiales bacterium]|nr:Gldg family protein [Burkholderiales bacterium]
MDKKRLEHLIYSAAGVAALFLILVAFNYLTSPVNARIDLTEGHVYTLSAGTRAVLGRLESPVRIRYYVTQGEGAMPVQLKTYAQRVEDLLNEFRRAAGGKLVIEKLNPQPDSDAEDSATLDGIEGQLLNTGDKFYFGLAVSQLDQKVAIPVLTTERERLLEYDLTRAIARVATTEKPTVGVMSALPVFGRGLGPRLMQQGGGLQEPWVLISELKRDFNVKEVEMSAETIPDDIKVLLVIHPRDISEVTQWAIDQFVLRGGKLIAFLDPYAYFDQQRDFQNPLGGTQAAQSTFYTLLKAWGIDMDMSKVIADMSYASGQGSRLLPTLLSLSGTALNADDVVMSQVGSLLIPFGGTFSGKPAAGLTETVLARTSPNSMPVDLIIATLSGEPSTRGFKPSGTENPIAIRLTGKFKTAYPDGKPKPYAPPPEKGKEAAKAEEKPVASLKESTGEGAVVLVADADMLTDNAAVDIQDVFGQRVVVPRNGNLNFAQSLVEQFSGDDALMSLRSRAAFSRPLTVVKDMEARAQQSYLGKIKELEDNLQETQKKLEDLQKRRGQAQATILSPEQQAEVDNFRKKAAETKKDLKELRKNLRQDADALEFWTKVANIGVMPVLVALAGIGLALAKRKRAAAR